MWCNSANFTARNVFKSCCMQFQTKQGKDLKVSYPCIMLNVMVAENNTNEQYQTLVDPATRQYTTSREMSIEFEVDGPYKVQFYYGQPSVHVDLKLPS